MDVKLYFIDETNLDQQSKHVVGKINKIATKKHIPKITFNFPQHKSWIWLIDWLGVSSVSAVYQPFNGGEYD